MPLPRNTNVSRLEAFSDAIFGFAAVVLVIDLKAPVSYAALVDNLRVFPSFALSFTTLVLLWAVHNAFFRRYEIEDATTIVLNAVFLFCVVFYVNPLKFAMNTLVALLAGGRLGVTTPLLTRAELAHMFVIYGVGWTAAFLCVTGLYAHAARRAGALGLDARGAYDAGTHARHYLMHVVAGAVCTALALAGVGVHVGLPGLAFALLGPLCWWNGATRARRVALEGLTA